MSEKICLLCGINKVYYIKSHLTPAGITENTYGKRDEELIYTIDPTKKSIDKYFGPANPQTESTEIKLAPNSRKGIFCKKCESDFGIYENAVQDKLNELINSIGKGLTIHRSSRSTKFVEIGIHSNVLATFFQSIVWRQCIEQQLDGQDNPLNVQELEKLRTTVLLNISTPLNQIEQKDLGLNSKMAILTTYCTSSHRTPSYVNPNTANTNPLLFFIGPVVLLYWLSDPITPNFEKITEVDNALLSDEVSLDKAKLSIVNSGVWKRIHAKLAKTVARQYLG